MINDVGGACVRVKMVISGGKLVERDNMESLGSNNKKYLK